MGAEAEPDEGVFPEEVPDEEDGVPDFDDLQEEDVHEVDLQEEGSHFIMEQI